MTRAQPILIQANMFYFVGTMRVTSQGHCQTRKEKRRDRQRLCGTSHEQFSWARNKIHSTIFSQKNEASVSNMILFLLSLLAI